MKKNVRRAILQYLRNGISYLIISFSFFRFSCSFFKFWKGGSWPPWPPSPGSAYDRRIHMQNCI